MQTLLIVENPKSWRLSIDGAQVVSAREYISDARYASLKRAKVFNLCRNYSYQSVGYYVSLLAMARGHKPLPSVTTLQDLRSSPVLRIVSDGLQQLVDRSLRPLKSDQFELSIYWGRNLARRYDRLSQALFDHFPSPLLRAEFERQRATDSELQGQWRLKRLRVIAWKEIPADHEEFVISQAKRFFHRKSRLPTFRPQYDLAVLVNPDEADAPSDERALRRFERVAKTLGVRCSFVTRADYGRIAEFDGLFIRETTRVNHHTYRFARRAQAEGLAVIDDPESIIRCTNKVYLAELFRTYGIAAPRSRIVSRHNAVAAAEEMGLPLVLKQPDSSFSRGVVKVQTKEELLVKLEELFASSELLVAQEFLPSDFDWRIGVLDGAPLYACKYYMAKGHWQILLAQGNNRTYGRHETLPLDLVPEGVLRLALQACQHIGSGLYGVDIKQSGEQYYVIEVNDNPNIDAGVEDTVLGDELYARLARSFIQRIEAQVPAQNWEKNPHNMIPAAGLGTCSPMKVHQVTGAPRSQTS